MPTGHRQLSQTKPSIKERSEDTTPVTGLPKYVRVTVPKCAQPCLSSHIKKDFDCPNNDISCLCSRYSFDDFTLGEYAFICLRSNCLHHTTSEEGETYNVCAEQPDPVSATHSVLTIPPLSATATSPRTTQPLPTIQTATASPPPTLVTTTTQHMSPTSTSSDTTSTTTAGPAAPTDTPARAMSLTSAQTIGISVAAVGIAIISALAILFACRRRRAAAKRKGRHSYDFIDDAPPSFASPHFSNPGPKEPGGHIFYPGIDLRFEKRRTEWPSHYQDGIKYQFPAYVPYQDCQENTTKSPYTAPYARSDYARTTSQLLPEKPTTLALKPPKQSEGAVMSPATIFEEERGFPAPLAAAMPRLSRTMTSQRPQQSHFQDQYKRSRNNTRQPSLSLQIPQPTLQPSSIQNVASFPLPPPPIFRQASSESRLSERSMASNTSVLNYYANAETPTPDLDRFTVIEDQMQVRRAPPTAITVTRPVFPPQAVRTSDGSDHSNRTSFESTDPDEPTPPDEVEKRLSPVAESPIATIRYPKVPRSSNQTIPRSPVYRSSARTAVGSQSQGTSRCSQGRDASSSPNTPEGGQNLRRGHTPTLSGSTLAAKRRGDNLAQDLERGLHIKHSNYSPDDSQAPSRNQNIRPAQFSQRMRDGEARGARGGITNPRDNGPNWPLTLDLSGQMKSPLSLKSPLWEQPKLTPRREGNDLYLDLSLATPHEAYFPPQKW